MSVSCLKQESVLNRFKILYLSHTQLYRNIISSEMEVRSIILTVQLYVTQTQEKYRYEKNKNRKIIKYKIKCAIK